MENKTVIPPESHIPGFKQGLRDLPQALSAKAVSAGLVAAIFGCSGPALVVIGTAKAGALTPGQTVAWLMAIYIFGGLISLYFALRYKMPITGAYSIPGAAIMAAAFGSFAFPEMVGAFVMAGVIVFILGITGIIQRIMYWIPMPIVMGMISGAMIRFGVGAVDAVAAAPYIAGAAVVAYFLVARYVKAMPPVLAALIVGLLAALVTGSFGEHAIGVAFVMPELTVPTFTIAAFFGVALPLAALVIGAENAQATGVLMVEKYQPPVNAMTIVSGIGGVVAGFFGGHNANIAGPMTAICSSEQANDDPKKRYAATVVNGLLFATFGLCAGFAVPFIMLMPKSLIGVVAGLAMIGVLLGSLQEAFTKARGHQLGAFVALVVAMSSFQLFGISGAFWALVFGVVVSLLCDGPPVRPNAEAEH
ncbi:MAG: benzoate/H(+) symporter BenE family transporter [Neisseriaceae bacterium]|nr:benzoate/H(+) symporter BenE family transporter [Neisseriaceae bacterium]